MSISLKSFAFALFGAAALCHASPQITYLATEGHTDAEANGGVHDTEYATLENSEVKAYSEGDGSRYARGEANFYWMPNYIGVGGVGDDYPIFSNDLAAAAATSYAKFTVSEVCLGKVEAGFGGWYSTGSGAILNWYATVTDVTSGSTDLFSAGDSRDSSPGSSEANGPDITGTIVLRPGHTYEMHVHYDSLSVDGQSSAFDVPYFDLQLASYWDVNGDGVDDGNDVIAEANTATGHDFDGDGDVDNDDLALAIAHFGFLPGDFDHDGGVSINDFNIISANFGMTGATYEDGDIDGDGSVSINDFNIFSEFFGTTY